LALAPKPAHAQEEVRATNGAGGTSARRYGGWTDKLPSDDLWLHEIKHDGFRVIARKDGDRVRLYSRAMT